MATTEIHSLAGAPTPEEDAFELGRMLAQFRWNLLGAVYSDSSGAADELKSFVEHMQPLMMAILPELGGGEPYRIAKEFGDTFHEFQSFEHAEDFKRCFDLRGMVSPPEIVDAIYPLSRYLPSTADTLLKSTIDEVQGTPLLARCVQLGVLVAEGIYPPVSGRVFFEIRQSQQWLDLREREKARGSSPSKPGSGNSPTELAHDCKPLEFELHRRGISPGDLLPNDIWPDEVRRLLAAVNLRDLHAVGLDVLNCSPPQRVEKISQLTSAINQHLRSRAFIEGNHAENAIVETLMDCRYSEVAVSPTLDQPDLDSQVFGAPFVLPVLDQEDESDAGTALAPQTFSKSADSPPREEPSSRYLDLIVNFDRRTVSRSGEKYALIKPVSFSGDANWPLFCALFDKSGDALTKVEMNRLPGKGGAARRVLKMRLNEALFPLDVTIPDGEWKLIEAPRRNAKVARKQT